MSLSCIIIIERSQSQFPVTVIRGHTSVGLFEHPLDESSDEIYDLSESEQDEAVKLLYPTDLQCDQEPEPAHASISSKEQDSRAAEDWASGRIGR